MPEMKHIAPLYSRSVNYYLVVLNELEIIIKISLNI